jgi:ribosomal protein S12 methylthiotransferase
VSDASGEGPTRVGVISLGCSKNLVDTEVMLGHLHAAGCAFERDPARADVLVVNTCGFIDAAREESIRTILDAAAYKATGRLKRLVVAGCMVQRYADELRASLPEVDAFVGLDTLEAVVAAAGLAPAPSPTPAPGLTVLPRTARNPRRTGAAGAASWLYDERTPRRLATPPWTAYVKIAEGCDHTCAFCAIPSFRGAFRSRTLDSVAAEVESLVAGGVREVNLIAQDSSHYGRDLGLADGLALLLRRLDAVAGLRWIRVHYLYPNTVTAGMISALAELPKVAKYVDMPLQHAHAGVLRRMRRGGSAASHRHLIGRFRGAMPGAALRSTFIVGFPGETEAEFEALLDFVAETRFDHVGVFAYSHEDGTHAAALSDDVPARSKEARRDRLMTLQRAIVAELHAARVGRMEEVLVEGPHPDTEHLLVGRTSTQSPDVDGQVLLNDGLEPADDDARARGILGRAGDREVRAGDLVRVRITDVAGYDLVGKVLDAA